MIPKSLSATSAQVFESCAARWRDEYFFRAEQPGGSAANLGTACHGALEDWVVHDLHLDASIKFDVLEDLFQKHYDSLFPGDRSRYDEGVSMMERWYGRSHPLPHKVLSTEQKTNFMLPTSEGQIPFNYIWDRCDEKNDDPQEIEVIDYKSVARPIQPEGLKDKIQARCYGLAAQIAFPKAKRIWVTFDLLRYDHVGIVFTRDDNVETWHYLKALAERIIATEPDDAPETLNPECRWCIRKQVCNALIQHAAVGGVLGLSDPEEAASRRLELESARGGLNAALAEVDEFILEYMKREDILEYETDATKVVAKMSRRRDVDSAMAGRVIGSELLAKYGSIGVGAIDKMVKSGELTDEQAAELKLLITYKYGEPKVEVVPKNPIGGV